MDQLFNPTYINLEYIFNGIYAFFHAIYAALFTVSANARGGNVSTFQGILLLCSLFFIIITIYCIVRIFEIRKLEQKYIDNEIAVYAAKHSGKEKSAPLTNARWENVLTYLHSQSPSDWRIAIIEADLILEDITKERGLEGLNLGDRLKSADRDKFKTLSDAWEAHLVRNRIAHDGAGFILTMPEARRVLSYYEIVFRDLEVID